MTIVDRALGQDVPAGAWDAVFYQATHDSAGLDVGFQRNWSALRGKRRGAYHFARPGASSGSAQAQLLARRVHDLGWDAKKDLWALDIEVGGGPTGVGLANWITDFMETARINLGDRGFLYIGFPFYVTHVSGTDFRLLQQYRWWLPDYGRNDGNINPTLIHPVPPVLHQYTSNPFDKSVIVNATVWHDLFNPEVIVHQEFNPPLSIISETMFDHPTLGRCHVGLGPDGGAFCTPRSAFLGTVVGKPYFKGRKAARVVAVKGGYQTIATSGEKYGPTY